MMLCSILGVIWPFHIMEHDFSKVFDTENPLWQEVLAIFDANANILPKKTKGRALHHKYPRSFSKLFGEPEDNDPNNLVSLTHSQHFMVHYYYYKIARPEYAWRMAIPFRCMSHTKRCTIDNIDVEMANRMSIDYAIASKLATKRLSQISDRKISAETRQKMSERGKANMTEERKRQLKEAREAAYKRKYPDNPIPTPKTHRSRSEALKGKPKSEEHRRHISEGRKGIVFSEAHRQHIKEAMARRVLTPEQRDKMRTNLGKHTTMSEETKHKLAVANRGQKRSDESKRKMSLAAKGRKHGPMSEETKRKLSAALSGRKGHPISEANKAREGLSKRK